MAAQGNHDSVPETQKKPPPPLPPRLLDLQVLVITGTAVWFVLFLALLIAGSDSGWKWTSLAGGVLGLMGWSISLWQRSASRRGSRGAQRGL